MKKQKKLLLIGSTVNPVHIKNYYQLVNNYFDDVLIVGTHPVDFCKSLTLNFSIKNPIRLIYNIYKLRKIIKEYNPSVVHAHQANSIGFISALANKNRYPHVLTTWGDDVLIFPQKNFVYRVLAKTSLKYADVITADAKSMETAIHLFYKKVDVVIANFGIDLYPEDAISKENRIYSNRLHNDLYNIDKIILGCNHFLKTHPDWKLIIAGEGNNTSDLKLLVKKLDLDARVEFVGFLNQEENRMNYYKSKIYISIPNTDGTSISLLEAMAYGCIPLVSELASNKEWITDNVNGLIVKDFNVEEALQCVFSLHSENVIAKNKQIIEERATKQANRNKFYAIYDALINS